MQLALWAQNPYTSWLMLSGVATALCALYLRRRPEVPVSGTAALLLLACCEWSVASALEMTSPDLSGKLFWSKVEYLGIVAVPVVWLVFAVRYARRGQLLTPRVIASLVVVPGITFLLAATNEAHGLIWSDLTLESLGSFTVLRVTHGPWFWVHVLYSYGMLLIGTFLFIQMLLRSRRTYLWQARAMLLVVMVPWLENASYITGIGPGPGLDLTPLAFSLASIALAASITYLRLGDLIAVSRRAIIEDMTDGVVVLDTRDRVAYLNPAARALVASDAVGPIGRPVTEVWQDLAKLVADNSDGRVGSRELVLSRDGGQNSYEARVSPQLDWRGQVVSRVIVLRDITERKQVEGALLERMRLAALGSEVGQALTQAQSLREALQRCAEAMVAHTEADFARIWTVDQQGSTLELQASAGLYTHIDGAHSRMKLGDLRVGRIAVERKPYLTNDVADDPLVDDHEWAKREGIVALAGYPLVVEDRLVGAMAVFALKALADSALQAMASVASGIALGIEQQRAAEALQESEERYRTLAEAAQDIIFIVGEDGKLRYLNGFGAAWLGRSREDAVGKNLKELFPPDIVERELHDIGEAVRTAQPVFAQNRFHFGSRVAWLDTRLVPFRGQTGELAGVLGVSRDVTERKLAADDLLRFKLGIERSTEAVFMTDAQGKIIYVNPAFEDIYGFSREEAVGKTPRILKSGRVGVETYEMFWKTLLSKQPVTGELVNKTRDGRLVNIEGSANPILNDEGEIIGFLAIQRDITERKQLEERLLRAQRLETAGRIAGQVAHDFNNLLTPLGAYPELIKMQLPEDHPARRYCDPMLESVQQMAEINSDMLALGRRGYLKLEPTDLKRLVERAAQIVDAPPSLVVAVETAGDLPPVAGAPAQLLRVITNLVSNAREAMQDVGVLTLKTENLYMDLPFGRHGRVEPGEYVRLSVRDTGTGIAAEVQDRIFDTFFTTKRAGKKPGSGLGLSIVQAIVEDHRGYLDLETEVGKGTTFFVYLPTTSEALAPSTNGTLPRGHESVLVVDDDARQREAMREQLGVLGFQVRTVASGEEAVEYVGRTAVDLLILDMIMPGGMDGAETYGKVLAVRPNQKAIVVSGFAESDKVKEVQAFGARTYLRKPVTLDKLARAVREELDRA